MFPVKYGQKINCRLKKHEGGQPENYEAVLYMAMLVHPTSPRLYGAQNACFTLTHTVFCYGDDNLFQS